MENDGKWQPPRHSAGVGRAHFYGKPTIKPSELRYLANLWWQVWPSCERQANTHSQSGAGVLRPYRSVVQTNRPRRNGQAEPISVRTARTRFAAAKKWLKDLTDFLVRETGSRVCDGKGCVRVIAAHFQANRRALIRILDGVAQDVFDC